MRIACSEAMPTEMNKKKNLASSVISSIIPTISVTKKSEMKSERTTLGYREVLMTEPVELKTTSERRIWKTSTTNEAK